MTLARRAPERVHSLALAASAPVRMARTLALFGSLVAIRRSNAPADTWLNALLPWLFAPMVYDIEGAVGGGGCRVAGLSLRPVRRRDGTSDRSTRSL